MGIVEFLLTVAFAALGTGVTVTTSAIGVGEFWFARFCYIIAAIALIAAYLSWLKKSRTKPLSSVILQLALGLCAFISSGGILSLLLWVNERQEAVPDFEKTTGWSVSFDIPGLITWSPGLPANSDSPSYIVVHRCRFTNISTLHRRIIDIKLVVPTRDQNVPVVTFDTQTTDFQQYKQSLKKAGLDITAATVGKRNVLLENPIVIQPQTFMEGEIEFEMNASVAKKMREDPTMGWLRYGDASVYVTDHISHRTIGPVKMGEIYDASVGKIVNRGAAAAP